MTIIFSHCFKELVKELFSLKRELFSLRFQKVMKEITDTSRFNPLKKILQELLILGNTMKKLIKNEKNNAKKNY